MTPFPSPCPSPARRVRRAGALVGLTVLAPVPGAWAQDATHGQALYQQVIVTGTQTCAASACHGSAPSRNQNKIASGASAYTIATGISGVSQMRALQGRLTQSDLNDLAAYIAGQTGRTPTYYPVSSAPAVSLSTTSVGFGSVTLGLTATQTVTLTNSGNAALSVGTLSSSQPAFTAGSNCPTSLAAGAHCALSLSFTPALAGAYSGTVTLQTNASNSPHAITVSGTGAPAALALLGWQGGVTALGFADTTVGQAAAGQTLTLVNTGNASATLTAVLLAGTQAADFTLSGSCASGVSLAPGATCTVTVGFQPTASGARTASLQLTTSDATNPPNVSLTGTGVANPSPAPSPSPSPSPAPSPAPTPAPTPAPAPAPSPAPAPGTDTNAGGGGCSIGRPDTPLDPVWPTLLALSAGVLRQRRRSQGDRTDDTP